MPSSVSGAVMPSFSAYSAMMSGPSSRASVPKAQLQELASACSMVWEPWLPVQVSLAPSTIMLPSHQRLRSKRSGMLSMAAARVTSLNTEPGVKLELRHLLR